MCFAAFAGTYTANDVGSILDSLLRVESTLFSGVSLTNNFRIGVQFQIAPRLIVGRAISDTR